MVVTTSQTISSDSMVSTATVDKSRDMQVDKKLAVISCESFFACKVRAFVLLVKFT